MDLSDSPNVAGSVHGLWTGNHTRVEELNTRIFDRFFPDIAMEPNFSPRPVPTKYSHFPLMERRAQPTVPIYTATPRYSPSQHFAPATSNGPVSTYLANVDIETALQNRHIALQHGAEQSVYVPKSTSDLYKVSVYGRTESMGDRELLFAQPQFAKNSRAESELLQTIGQDIFHNNTRTQLRD